jgi:hypothetical protein
MKFKDWLLFREGGKGSGTKFSGTGLNAGGASQHGAVYRPTLAIARPYGSIKNKIRKIRSSI